MTRARPTPTPIVRQITVGASPDAAFRRFTAEMAQWWPLVTHSVMGQHASGIHFGEGIGQPIVELGSDGTRHVWGTIRAWEPPRRVAFTWHPGRDAARAQDVEVRFEPTAGGSSTRVMLTMSGWERLAAGEARRARPGYSLGWAYMLDRFADRRTFRVRTLDLLTAILGLIRRRGPVR